MFVYVCACVCAVAPVWRSEDSLKDSVLSTVCIPRIQLLSSDLVARVFTLLEHLHSCGNFFFFIVVLRGKGFETGSIWVAKADLRTQNPPASLELQGVDHRTWLTWSLRPTELVTLSPQWPLTSCDAFSLGNAWFGSGDVWILYKTLTSLGPKAAGEMLLSDSQAEGCQADGKGGS